MRNKGFTLLEILIAIFIFTFVAVMMVDAMHTVFSSQAATEKKATRLAELQMALLLMSRDFEQALNRPIINAQGILENTFVGTKNSVVFTHAGFANPLGQLTRSTLQRTQYSLKGNSLTRTHWLVLDLAPNSETSQRNLLNLVTELSFSYLDDQGKFQHKWPIDGQANSTLPRAVRVSLTIEHWGKISQLYVIAGGLFAKTS